MIPQMVVISTTQTKKFHPTTASPRQGAPRTTECTTSTAFSVPSTCVTCVMQHPHTMLPRMGRWDDLTIYRNPSHLMAYLFPHGGVLEMNNCYQCEDKPKGGGGGGVGDDDVDPLLANIFKVHEDLTHTTDNGAYAVRLFKNGQWEAVIVDDCCCSIYE